MNKKEYWQKWYAENKERLLARRKAEYYEKNKEKIEARKAERAGLTDEEWKKKRQQKYRDVHREEINSKRREKWKSDVGYREKENARVLEYRRSHREETRNYYNERNRRKTGHANQTVINAIISGKIKRGPCEVCGAEKAEAHHDDYNKPLEVRWLCKKCHVEWHKHNEPKYLI